MVNKDYQYRTCYTICLHANWKAYVAHSFNCRIETVGLQRPAHCKSGNIITRKLFKIETLLLQTTYMTYRIALFPVTLSGLQGHSPIANASFRIQLCSSRQDFN